MAVDNEQRQESIPCLALEKSFLPHFNFSVCENGDSKTSSLKQLLNSYKTSSIVQLLRIIAANCSMLGNSVREHSNKVD